MFLYIETKTGQTSSFILPVIDHELKTALIGKCPRERDRQGKKEEKEKTWKDETSKSGFEQGVSIRVLGCSY